MTILGLTVYIMCVTSLRKRMTGKKKEMAQTQQLRSRDD